MANNSLPQVPTGLDRGLTNFLNHLKQAIGTGSGTTTVDGGVATGITTSALQSALATLANSTGSTFVCPARPAVVEGVTCSPTMSGVLIGWEYPKSSCHSIVTVYRSPVSNQANAVEIDSSSGTMVFDRMKPNGDLSPDTTYYYWVKATDRNGISGDFQSVDGVAVTTSKGADYVDDTLIQAVQESQFVKDLQTEVEKIEPLAGLQSTAESLEALLGLSNSGLNAVEILKELVKTDIASYIDQYDGGDYCRAPDGSTVDLGETECVAAGHEWVNLIGIKDELDIALGGGVTLTGDINADVSTLAARWGDENSGEYKAILEGIAAAVSDTLTSVSGDTSLILQEWNSESDPTQTGTVGYVKQQILDKASLLLSQISGAISQIETQWESDPASNVYTKAYAKAQIAELIANINTGVIAQGITNLESEWENSTDAGNTYTKAYAKTKIVEQNDRINDGVISQGIDNLEAGWESGSNGGVITKAYAKTLIEAQNNRINTGVIAQGVSQLETDFTTGDETSTYTLAHARKRTVDLISDTVTGTITNGLEEFEAEFTQATGCYTPDGVLQTGVLEESCVAPNEWRVGLLASVRDTATNELNLKEGIVNSSIQTFEAEWNTGVCRVGIDDPDGEIASQYTTEGACPSETHTWYPAITSKITQSLSSATDLDSNINILVDEKTQEWGDETTGAMSELITNYGKAVSLKDNIYTEWDSRYQSWNNSTTGVKVTLKDFYEQAESLVDQIADSKNDYHLAMYTGRCVNEAGETQIGITQAACVSPNQWIESVDSEVAKVVSFHADLNEGTISQVEQFQSTWNASPHSDQTLVENVLEVNQKVSRLGGEWSVKIDTNGRVSGFGLASDTTVCVKPTGSVALDASGNPITDTTACSAAGGTLQTFSEFVVSVDKFKIVHPDTDKAIFTTSLDANGNSQVVMDAAYLNMQQVTEAVFALVNADQVSATLVDAIKAEIDTLESVVIKDANGRFVIDTRIPRLTVTDESGTPRIILGKL